MTTLTATTTEPNVRTPEGAAREAGRWGRAAERWYYVARYHRPGQLGRRLWMRAVRLRAPGGWRRLLQRAHGAIEARPDAALGLVLDAKLEVRRARGAGENAARLRAGRYRFLNEERALPDPIDWRSGGEAGVPHLWRFHLHYHEFLLDLLADGLDRGDSASIERCWDIVREWIEGNPLRDRRELTDAWHPFCISRRLPVWALLWQAAPPGPELSELVLSSVFAQATYLEGHLERDLGGNHLLENARGLALAGALIAGPGGDDWLRTSEEIFRAELPEQILPHGEHFERSPMYHANMLELLLDVSEATAAARPLLSDLCRDAAAPMAEHLGRIVHPDGEIPLLGDSCLGEAPPAEMLLRRAACAAASCGADPRTMRGEGALRSGDTWTWRDGGDFVLFDGGPVGPDHLPAHAHADLLTLEASIAGRRLIVDSGVFGYGDDEMRSYCRSSAAHNVLQIDDADQCDMWSRFRMGHRGYPAAMETGSRHGFDWAAARHNAYRRTGVSEAGRWIACRAAGPWFVIDWAIGAGRHLVTTRLHFYPTVLVEQISDDELRLELDDVSLSLRCLAPGELRVTSGWYCPEFGRRVANPVAEWRARAELPAVCGWMLSRAGRPEFAALQRGADGTVSVILNGREELLCRPLCASRSADSSAVRRMRPR